MRNKFREQLEILNRELLIMGAMCEQAILEVCRAFEAADQSAAKEIMETGQEIDQQERKIEGLCLKLFLQQQPVARDLRQISAALKMITDMERIGDQAADIAEIMLAANCEEFNKVKAIGEMGKATIRMVTNSIDAYVKRDLQLAKDVIEYDDKVDALFQEVKEHLIRLISKDTRHGEYAIDLLMIAKYFERIGDHTVNIAEWVEFSITGKHKGE